MYIHTQSNVHTEIHCGTALMAVKKLDVVIQQFVVDCTEYYSKIACQKLNK